MTDIEESPARSNPYKHVHPAIATRFGIAVEANLLQQLPQFLRNPHRIVKISARLRIEIDAQFIWMIGPLATNSPGVKNDRTHVRCPHHRRDFGGAQLVGNATRGKSDACCLHI